jgi:hypothetical protein
MLARLEAAMRADQLAVIWLRPVNDLVSSIER